MKLRKRIFIVAIIFSFIPSFNIFASSWFKSHDAGRVEATKSGNTHNTIYTASRVNRSGCANTLAKNAGYGDSSCAFLSTTDSSTTKLTNSNGHYHVYMAFNGALPNPVVYDTFISWNVANFQPEY